jgi:hypothetical protein
MSIMDIVCVWRWPMIWTSRKDWKIVTPEFSCEQWDRLKAAVQIRWSYDDVWIEIVREVAESTRDERVRWRAQMILHRDEGCKLRRREPGLDAREGCRNVAILIFAVYGWMWFVWPIIADYFGWQHN